MGNLIVLQLDTLGKQIVFYIFLSVALALILYALYRITASIIAWLKTGGKIKIKDAMVSNGDDARVIPPVHAGCPHVKDIMRLVTETARLSSLKTVLPYTLLAVQMRYAEEKAIEARTMLLEIFVKELDTYLSEDIEPVQHPEYIGYTATLMAAEMTLKELIRTAMLQNHFTDFTGDAWDRKKERYRTMILSTLTDFFNLYWRGVTVPRWRLYELHHLKENMRKFESIINDLFDFAHTEAVKAEKRLYDAEKEFADYLRSSFTG